MNESVWKELVHEFRALGGKAENVRLGNGTLGRGLFAIDPQKPVTLHAPDNLLIDSRNMIFAQGKLRVGPGATVGARERAFLERYQAELSWGGGGKAEIAQIFESVAALPGDLRHQLLTGHRCGAWFEEPSDELIQQQFLASRRIDYNDRTVLMPILELANHGTGGDYKQTDGISMVATVADEILVRYAESDSYGFFLSWGFASQQPTALSIALAGTIGPSALHIGRLFGSTKNSQRAWIPEIAKGEEGATLNFLMIGNQRYPRLPKGIFYRVLRDAGYSGVEEGFDTIQHVNRLHFLDLLAALDSIDLPMARTLRNVAQYQLRAMSYCFGARAI